MTRNWILLGLGLSFFSLFAGTPPLGVPKNPHQHKPHCAVKLHSPAQSAYPITFTGQRPERERPVMRRMKATACTAAEFAALSGGAFADAVASSDDSCLGNLWSFSASVATAISSDRVSAVVSSINSESQNLTTNAARVDQLLNYLQIAFYHEFYEGSITYSSSLVNQARQAVADVGFRSGFLNENDAALSSMRYQWSITIDSTNGSHRAIGPIQWLLDRFRNNAALESDWYERSLAFNLFFTMSRQVGNYNISDGTNSPWYNLIPSSLMTTIRAYATDTTYNDDTVSIINNAIFTLGNFSVLAPSTASAAHEAISAAYLGQTSYSQPWLRAVTDIDSFYNGTLYDGTVLDLNQIRADVEAAALPYTYTYDEGNLIFRTAISKEKADLMYDAMQEVEAQFFRKTTFLDPTPGDTNSILTLTIYGSPADYQQYQPFLYGLSTNNGGIYIEVWGNLFTYDRTPQESYLTLEDLLRHEYVHYLDGYHVVVPTFGNGDIYQNDRLTWYAEGLAEFLVGSTRDLDVLPRATYLDIIDRDSSRMTVSEIMNASYSSGFRFYQYSGLYYNYMNQERPDLLVDLFDRVRGNNAANLDALYNSMGSSSSIQNGYTQFLDTWIAHMKNGTETLDEDVPTERPPANLPSGNASAIESALRATAPTADGAFRTWEGRYSYTGQLSLATGGANDAGIHDLYEAQMDSLLNALEPQGLNFNTAVSWFGNVTTNGGTATATYVVEGHYAGGAGDTDPPAPPSGLSANAATGAVTLNWTANSESDLSGYSVYRAASSGGSYTKLNTALITTTTYTDSGLAGGATYYYVITATDTSSNESGNSGEVSATPPVVVDDPPSSPTGLVATASSGQISLAWNANSESDLAGYHVYRATVSGGPYSRLTGATQPATVYTDSAVSAGTTYYYVVTANDTGGNESANSSESSATPPVIVDNPPATPNGLTATASTQQVSLSWNANTESDLAGYHVYRATTNGGPYNRITGSPQSATSYTDSGLTGGTTYFYVVTANDNGGNESGASGQASATPTNPSGGPPAVPTGLSATASPGQIIFSWNANSEPDLAGYAVYRSEPGQSWTEVGFVTATSYVDTDVVADNWYYYIVRAENTSAQRSNWSSAVSAQAIAGGGGTSDAVLIVNASYNGSTSYVSGYENNLDDLGVAHESWVTSTQGDPTLADLSAYPVVVWCIGYYHSGYSNQLNANQRAIIRQFLDQGGNLVISGAYAASYLDQTTLFTDYFHCTHVQYDMNAPGIVSVAGGQLSSTGWLSFNSTYNQSEVDITAPAKTSFTIDPYYNLAQSSGTMIFTVEDGYKVAYFSYPYTYLTDYMRENLMDQILTWMAPTIPRN